MTYVPLVLLGFVGLLVGGHVFLSWLLGEASEGEGEAGERQRPPRSFYNPRTWAAFRRLTAKRPPLLMYRRDKNGRFRKLSPGLTSSPARPSRRRSPRRPRRIAARPDTRIPAE